MGADLKQRQGTQTTLQPPVIKKAGRSAIWPYVATGIALVALVVAGVLFVTQDTTVPFQSDVAVIEGSFAGSREQGPYVAPEFRPIDIEGLMTGLREGPGATVESKLGSPEGFAESAGVMAQLREGGSSPGPADATAFAASREQGPYA
jgi:hypothetical protein